MIKNFFICGLLGWFLEVIWTGLSSLMHKDFTLVARTSLWMFPIYGMATFIKPIYNIIQNENIIIRGGLYTIAIFTIEFITGIILKFFHACPWDYSMIPCNLAGVIRLDYAPLWFITGLLFEKILIHNKQPAD